MDKISKHSISVWKVTSIIGIVIWSFISIGIFMGLNHFTPLSMKIILLICGLPLLGILYSIIRLVKLSVMIYESWSYSIKEDMVILYSGIIFKQTKYIPMSRVQHIHTNQGPILKRYNLREVTISTAGGSHEIPCLEDEVAINLQETIANSAERSCEVNGL
ncbi:MAG: PH domain-containing protein [Clostridium sp.]